MTSTGWTELVLVLLVLASGLPAGQASRGFMVLEENKQRDDASYLQEPAPVFYPMFGGLPAPQGIGQLLAQPPQVSPSQPGSFGVLGNQLDGVLSSGYDQVARRLQQVQKNVPQLDDGQRLLIRMYDMLSNPEETCRNLGQQVASPVLKLAAEQSQNGLKSAQSLGSQVSSTGSSLADSTNSLLNRVIALGKK